MHAGTLRWELSRVYTKRDKDETDWMAACVLWEQALEVMADEEDRTQVKRLSLCFVLFCFGAALLSPSFVLVIDL